jgi:hypothetical protein
MLVLATEGAKEIINRAHQRPKALWHARKAEAFGKAVAFARVVDDRRQSGCRKNGKIISRT